MKKYYITIFLLVFCIFSKSAAQNGDIKFERITGEEGLAHGVVYSIIQDSRGYMWFAGEGGLNRFDGYNFKIYQHDPLKNSVSSNDVGYLYEDQEGYIWTTSWGGGINRFDPATKNCIHYQHNRDYTLTLSFTEKN